VFERITHPQSDSVRPEDSGFQDRILESLRFALERLQNWQLPPLQPGIALDSRVANADRLDSENAKLRLDNAGLHSENDSLQERRIEFNLVTAAVGIGIGLFLAFLVARGIKRAWQLSARGKQLAFMVCGAVWMTVAALVAVNSGDLSEHPVNMLFTVLVYSLPAFAFGGIGFWWFGRQAETREHSRPRKLELAVVDFPTICSSGAESRQDSPFVESPTGSSGLVGLNFSGRDEIGGAQSAED
jgi:hypothetical protein